MNLKLEAIVIPVSDVDRAKKFYQDGNGWLIRKSSSVLQDGEDSHRQLQVDYHVTFRLGTTDQQIALGGQLERFGLVVYIARDQAAFASVADPRTARPAHRHVTGFREIEKARKLCVPGHIEAAAHKRHSAICGSSMRMPTR